MARILSSAPKILSSYSFNSGVNIPFSVDKCLFSYPSVGSFIFVCFSNFYVVTEYVVETDFKEGIPVASISLCWISSNFSFP